MDFVIGFVSSVVFYEFVFKVFFFYYWRLLKIVENIYREKVYVFLVEEVLYFDEEEW